MSEDLSYQHMSALLGSIEPHAPLLNAPPDGQLLYKVMTVENLLRSIVGSYLHFTRVDSYADLLRAAPHADPYDVRRHGKLTP